MDTRDLSVSANLQESINSSALIRSWVVSTNNCRGPDRYTIATVLDFARIRRPNGGRSHQI
jgi:hypothetical protein